MILKLLYISLAVEDVNETRRVFSRLFGWTGQAMAPDPWLGTDRGARLPFPNGCWLYVMESKNPASPVFQHVEQRGPGLERVAFLSDDIEAEFERVRKGGVELDDDALVETPSGRRFAVPPEYVCGVRVEIFEPEPGYWDFDAPSSISGVLGLQHIGVAVEDLRAADDAFERLFELAARGLRDDQHGGEQLDMMIEPGNDRLWLHVTQSWGPQARVRHFLDEVGEGLEHLCIEVEDIRRAVIRVTDAGVPIHDHKIFTNRPDGFEAFVYPEHTTGVTIELIEPYPTSRGYRPRR